MATNFGGLSDSLEYNEFELDSFDCNQSKNENFYTTDWPNFFLGKPLNNVAALKITEVSIPFTFYLINATNNTFQFTEFDGTTTHTQTITIPIGNYSSTSIATELS